jgi:hypothetical protein
MVYKDARTARTLDRFLSPRHLSSGHYLLLLIIIPATAMSTGKITDEQLATAAQLECAPSKAHGIIEARAQQAIDAAHQLSPREAIRAYPMAIFWSLMVSMCVIMEGQHPPPFPHLECQT